MIIGIGIDTIEIERISRLLKNFPEKFMRRVFTDQEHLYCARAHRPAASYAKRFAAKEACLKAMGVGRAQSIQWTDVEVGRSPLGQPQLILHRVALEYLQQNFGHFDFQCHLSLTDTKTLAQAQVIISRGNLS